MNDVSLTNKYKKITIDIVFGTEDGEKTLIAKTGRGDIIRVNRINAENAGIMNNAKYIPRRVSCMCREGSGVPYRQVWWCGFATFTKEPIDFKQSSMIIPDELCYLF
jgi:hypothetical protein